jgi:hypothetical protein
LAPAAAVGAVRVARVAVTISDKNASAFFAERIAESEVAECGDVLTPFDGDRAATG